MGFLKKWFTPKAQPIPQAEPDPLLQAQAAAAKADRIDAVQQSTSDASDQLARLFGSRARMSGSGMKVPTLGY